MAIKTITEEEFLNHQNAWEKRFNALEQKILSITTQKVEESIPPLITAQQAAEILKKKVRSITKAFREERLRGQKVGNQVLIFFPFQTQQSK
jgi:hypothetical protein